MPSTRPATIAPAHGAAEAALPALDWWRGFGSRELTAVVEQGQVANFDIAIAIAQIKQADAQARIAGAPLLPSIDLNGSATVARPVGARRSSGAGGNNQLYATSLSASYIWIFGVKTKPTLAAAEENCGRQPL